MLEPNNDRDSNEPLGVSAYSLIQQELSLIVSPGSAENIFRAINNFIKSRNIPDEYLGAILKSIGKIAPLLSQYTSLAASDVNRLIIDFYDPQASEHDIDRMSNNMDLFVQALKPTNIVLGRDQLSSTLSKIIEFNFDSFSEKALIVSAQQFLIVNNNLNPNKVEEWGEVLSLLASSQDSDQDLTARSTQRLDLELLFISSLAKHPEIIPENLVSIVGDLTVLSNEQLVSTVKVHEIVRRHPTSKSSCLASPDFLLDQENVDVVRNLEKIFKSFIDSKLSLKPVLCAYGQIMDSGLDSEVIFKVTARSVAAVSEQDLSQAESELLMLAFDFDSVEVEMIKNLPFFRPLVAGKQSSLYEYFEDLARDRDLLEKLSDLNRKGELDFAGQNGRVVCSSFYALSLILSNNFDTLVAEHPLINWALSTLEAGRLFNSRYMNSPTYTEYDYIAFLDSLDQDKLAVSTLKEISKIEDKNEQGFCLKRFLFADREPRKIYEYLANPQSAVIADAFGDFAKSGTSPFDPVSDEWVETMQKTHSLQRRLIENFFGFFSFTFDCKRVGGQPSALVNSANRIANNVQVIKTKDYNSFPGNGFIIEGVDLTKFLPVDHVSAMFGNDPLMGLKEKYVPWAKHQLDVLSNAKIYLFRGFIAISCKDKLHRIDREDYTLIMFNEHFNNPSKEVANLVPTKSFNKVLSRIRNGEESSRVIPSVLSMLGQVAPNKNERLYLGTASVTSSSMSNAYLPGTTPYFSWQNNCKDDHIIFGLWTDISGHIHNYFVPNQDYDYGEFDPDSQELSEMREAHYQVSGVTESLLNIFDLFKLGLANDHKGYVSRQEGQEFEFSDSDIASADGNKTESDGPDDEYSLTPQDNEILDAQSNPYRFKRLREAIFWHKNLKSSQASRDEYPVLAEMNIFSGTRFSGEIFYFDTFNLTLYVDNQTLKLNSDNARTMWDKYVVPRFVKNPNNDLRLVDREYIRDIKNG